MHTWKTHLRGVLHRLVRTHAHSPLSEIQQILAEVLEAEEVRFQDARGRDIWEGTTLEDLLSAPFHVALRVAPAPSANGVHAADVGVNGNVVAAQADTLAPRRPAPAAGVDAPPHAGSSADGWEARYESFCREFDRLERRHGFMWAGYIVKELLPRLGFEAESAKAVLDQLQAEGLVKVSKVPNPKNPLFPATGVQLNHDHPRVRAALCENEPVRSRFVPADGSMA